jgi:hypothetical protein
VLLGMILHDRLVEATEISPMRQRRVKWNPKKAPHAVGVMQKHAVIIHRPCGAGWLWGESPTLRIGLICPAPAVPPKLL